MHWRFVSSGLILVQLLNPVFAAARDNLTFEKRLADMEAEAARFLSEKLASGDTFAPGARARVTLLNLPAGSEVAVLLRNGQRIPGELGEVESEEFALLVDLDSDANLEPTLSQPRGTHVKRRFRLEDVENIDLSKTDWMSPEALPRFKVGKRLEILMLDGSRVRGQLRSTTADAFTLEQEGKTTRDYRFEQVAMARKSGMKTSTVVWIGVGAAVAFVALGLITVATLDLECRGNCNIIL